MAGSGAARREALHHPGSETDLLLSGMSYDYSWFSFLVQILRVWTTDLDQRIMVVLVIRKLVKSMF